MASLGKNYTIFISNIPYGTSPAAITTGSFSSLTFTTIVRIPASQAFYYANIANISTGARSTGVTVTPVASGGLSAITVPTSTFTTTGYLVQQFNVIFPGSSTTPIVFTNVLWMS
jgi:hypothetical protein